MDHPQLIHLAFKGQAQRTPDRKALIDPEAIDNKLKGQWTYRELDDVSDRLAALIKKSYDIQSEDAIAILMPRSGLNLIAMLSILKTGGCFVPIEMAYPPDLIASVITDTKPKAILTVDTDATTDLDLKYDGGIVFMSHEFLAELPLLTDEDKDLLKEDDPDDLDRRFFITMSSGTTGRPKGIVQLHKGAAYSFISRMEDDPYHGSPETSIEACNVFFIWEALRAICYGAASLVISDSAIYDATKLLPILRDYKVTNMLFTPSLFELMANQASFKESVETMRFVVFCGEVVSALTYTAADSNLPSVCKLYNSYSISETFDIAGGILQRGVKNPPAAMNCGKTLAHAKIFVLDDKMNPCPSGVDGNVYVAGHSLARSYFGLKELTLAKFTEIPSHLLSQVPKEFPNRLYNCGDAGSWEGDELRIGGRADSMIKIRGYSVELGAITSAIELSPIVKECAVIADGDAAASNKTLVAYFTLKPNIDESLTETISSFTSLRRYLIDECRKVLPSYSIPSVFIQVDHIPISSTSGKAELKGLPDWREKMTEQVEIVKKQQMDTATPMELKVLGAIRKVLAVDSDLIIEPCDSFFEVGGHSLSATLYLHELRASVLQEQNEMSLTLEDIFKYPVVSTMAKFLSRLCGEEVEIIDETPDLVGIVDVLTQDLKPFDRVRSFWRALETEQKWGSTRVLLTGAKGWLGSHLLANMLEKTDYLITVVVRAGNDEMNEDIIRHILTKNKLMTNDEIDRCIHRVRVLFGDISRFDLGLGHELYQELTTRIDCVVHAAANVNLMLPFSALRPANIDGTLNILKFCVNGHIKQLHYVSTNGVIPSSYHKRVIAGISEDDELMIDAKEEPSKLLPSGYAQTKWVSEQLCRKYQRAGLPTTIYRIGNIGGHTRTGMWNPQDTNLAFLRICSEIRAIPTGTGHVPTIIGSTGSNHRLQPVESPSRRGSFSISDNEPLTIEVTPVDFVAEAICGGISNIRKVSGRTVHLIQPKKTPLDYVLTAFEHVNMPLKRVSIYTWNEMLREKNIVDPVLLRQFSLFLNDNQSVLDMFGRHVPCQVENYKMLTDSAYPEYSTSELIRSLKGLAVNRLISQPTERPKNLPLLNRLVLVTGASSGIGEAVCEELITKGANLIIMARRQKNLQDLKHRLRRLAPPGNDTPKIYVAVADITDATCVAGHVADAEDLIGDKVWGLVHCAGVMHYMRIANLEVDVWHKEIDINCKGTVNAIQAVLPSMKLRNRGHIVCISSDAGKKSFDGLAVYSGTKAFVEFFCESLRREVCPDIKVTTIAPGDVKTELLLHNKDPEALTSFGAGPGAEMLEPSDIAETISFALTRKDHAAVNSIIIEPREAPI